jgi:hypothetical protein
MTLMCVVPCIFVIIVNFVANKCTLFILFLYVQKQNKECAFVGYKIYYYENDLD